MLRGAGRDHRYAGVRSAPEQFTFTFTNSPMYKESHSGQAFLVQQPLCGSASLWLKNRNEESAAHQCRNGTHVASMVHTFLRSNVLAVVRVVQMH